MKLINQLYIIILNMIIDKNIYERHFNYFKFTNFIKSISNTLLSSAITYSILSPLYVISILKQLSVPAHKHIYNDPNIKPFPPERQLSFKEKVVGLLGRKEKKEKITFDKDKPDESRPIRKEGEVSQVNESNKGISQVKRRIRDKIDYPITLRERVNKELVQSSGVQEGGHPYRAPIFEKYTEMLRVLNRQGVLSYWKGLMYRVGFMFSPSYIMLGINNYLTELSKVNNYSVHSYQSIYFIYSCIEFVIHPFYLIESRYILQNRLPHFRVYNSLFKLFNRSSTDLYQGALSHFPKNFLLFSVVLLMENLRLTYSFPLYISLLTGFTVIYPVNTVIRRLCCQSLYDAGMIPIRYINLLHGMSLIYREEGIRKGLYKGYIPYIIGMYLLFKYYDFFTGPINSMTRKVKVNIDDSLMDEKRRLNYYSK